MIWHSLQGHKSVHLSGGGQKGWSNCSTLKAVLSMLKITTKESSPLEKLGSETLWVMKTFYKLVLIYWIIICYGWNAADCWFQLHFAAEKKKCIIFVCSVEYVFLSVKWRTLKLVSWIRDTGFTLSDAF